MEKDRLQGLNDAWDAYCRFNNMRFDDQALQDKTMAYLMSWSSHFRGFTDMYISEGKISRVIDLGMEKNPKRYIKGWNDASFVKDMADRRIRVST